MSISSEIDCDDVNSSAHDEVANMFVLRDYSSDEDDEYLSNQKHSYNVTAECSTFSNNEHLIHDKQGSTSSNYEHLNHEKQVYSVTGQCSTSSNDSNSSSTMKSSGVENTYVVEVPHDVRPDVPEDLKPNDLMMFKSVSDAIDMYKSYAEKAGFDVRLYTERKVGEQTVHKYLVCHRNGKPPKKSLDIDNKRNTCYKAIDCKAKIVVKLIKGTTDYKFDKFEELHNHEMEDESHLKKGKSLFYSDQEFVLRASTVKIGAQKAFKIRATLKGGFEHVNGNAVDFKNFKRDIGCVIGFRDAQLLVNKMMNRKENYPNYSFYYRLDENKVLNALFWADETEKAYYTEFGDVLSFVATFRTNKYGLVFVPFTVIDHHKSSVTVGAGLLSTEDVDSYKWLLEHFLKAHGNKHPVLVLTDQCASLKQAVESMFLHSKHRLCMWHILKKLPKKLGADFLKTTSFKNRFENIVWDMYMKPDVFEYKWNLLMGEFTFTEKTTNWFKKMFNIRDSWIPSFFNDYLMCGLMKTTSRSESMNSFFNSYSQDGNFLISFMKNYDHAIEKMRYTQRELDHKSKGAQYVLTSPREIEKHIGKVYTSKMFFEVQKELSRGAWYCEVVESNQREGWEVYSIKHLNQKFEFVAKYKVEIKVDDKEIKCSCGHFNRYGILCRHVFKILLNKNYKEIPEEYISRRWRKDVIYSNYKFSRDCVDEGDADITKLVNQGYFNFESCLDFVRNDKEKLAAFVEKTEVMLKDMRSDPSNNVSRKRKTSDVVEKFYGVEIIDDVEIQVPKVQHNKGCGKKRFVGEGEKQSDKAKKKFRKCSGCGKNEPHNYRTCPVRLAAQKKN